MSTAPLPAINHASTLKSLRTAHWDRWIARYARIALGAAFLSGIASRFGWWGKNVGYGNFDNFVKYTAKVNSFMPASTIPFLAWSATAAELFLGVALLIGVWRQWVAWASALLLLMFGTAMAISFGIKEPLDYSVFSAAAAAMLLAQSESNHRRKNMSPELKAFVDSLVGPATDNLRDKSEPAHGVLRRIARHAAALFTVIGDALEEFGPYTCELRPIQKIKTALAEFHASRDAIGYHGLT